MNTHQQPTTPYELLQRRWGQNPAFTPEQWNETLSTMVSHRSVRQWLDREVSENTIRTVAAAAQSASTSSNKQVVSVVAVRDTARKQALAEVAGPLQKSHVSTAPVVLVWCIDTSRIRQAIETANAVADSSAEPAQYVAAEYIDEVLVGASDCGIAAQNAAVAAESLGLGTVYLGSLRNDAGRVAEIINAPEHVVPFVGLELGYGDPAEAADIKPRLPQDAFLHFEQYSPEYANDVESYENTLGSYYADYGKASQWGKQLVARVGEKATTATKRHQLSELLQRAGFGLR